MRRFTVVLTPDEDSYMIMVPALPGCFTQGTTREEALAHAKDAISLYLEQLAAEGEPVPDDTVPELVAVEVEAAPVERAV